MKSFLKLWPFIRPQKSLLITSVLLAFPLSAIRFSPAPMIQFLTDSILVKKDMKMLLLLPLAIIGLYILNIFLRFGHAYFGRLANERVMRDIREKLFQHYLSLSSQFFTDSTVGSLISRVTNDVFYVSHGTVNITNIVKETITFLAIFGYAVKLNPKLLALTLLVGPMIVWLGKRSGILMKGYSSRMQEANAHVYSALQEAFSGFKVVKAFSMEKSVFNRFQLKNNEYVKFALKAARVEEIGGPLVDFMAAVSIALVLYVGGRDVIQGRLTPGELLAFFTCFGLMIQPVRVINDINMKLSQAGASADRVHETLAIQSSIQEIPGARALPPFRDQIEFRSLGFRYSPELPWIFKDLTFTVKRGQMVALVGASGQGKSSLINLIPRFYDPVAGQIFIDGQDIAKVQLQSLRDQIALVTQDVFLFNDTVFANIAAGKPGVTPLDVHKAAEAAHALPFIEKLPQGFDTLIGDRGQKLSGGERQRISIARAILRNAPILLLDEATSSLDTESEKAVQKALETLMQGRTTIVVAHRLSTIRHADEILVLSQGQIAEQGTHDQLLSGGGEYARFYALLG